MQLERSDVRKLRQERGIPKAPLPIRVDLEILQSRTSRQTREIRDGVIFFNLQFPQLLQPTQGGDIPKAAEIVYSQLIQRFGFGKEREIFDGKIVIQLAFFQRGTGFQGGEVQRAPQLLTVVDPQPFELRRAEAGTVGLLRTDQINVYFAQLFTGGQRAVIRVRTRAVQQIHMSDGRSAQPFQIGNHAVSQHHAPQAGRSCQIRHCPKIDLAEIQLAELRHQAQKTQILVAGHRILVPVFPAVIMRLILIVIPVSELIPFRPVPALADFVAAIEFRPVAHDQRNLNLFKVLLRQSQGIDGRFFHCLTHGRNSILALSAPEKQSDHGQQRNTCHDQQLRQTALLLRQGGGNALGDQSRVPAGGGDDVAGIEGVHQRLRHRRLIQPQGEQLLRPGAHQRQELVRLFLVGVKALRECGQGHVVPAGLPFRGAQALGGQGVQDGLQLLPVLLGTEQADGSFGFHRHPPFRFRNL